MMRPAKVHELKTHPQYFQAILDGRKTFEVRQNDRDFQFGDLLRLREYDPSGVDPVLGRSPYTGRAIEKRICYILNDPEYCKLGQVVMALEDTSMEEMRENLRAAVQRIAYLEGCIETRHTRGNNKRGKSEQAEEDAGGGEVQKAAAVQAERRRQGPEGRVDR